MIELILFNKVYNVSNDSNSPTLSPDQKSQMKKDIQIATAVALVLYLLIFALAIYRALICSSNNPDSKAIHLFFATVSPLLYIVISYVVPGFDQNVGRN
jgi:hypothetical protein